MLSTMMLLVCFATGVQETSAQLIPFDLSSGNPDSYLSSIGQIESNGNLLFVRSPRHTSIYIFNKNGVYVGRIGDQGQHPSEFGHTGVLALALNGQDIWAIDMTRVGVRHFQNGVYKRFFRLKSYNVHFTIPTSNVFAFSENKVVVPTHPSTGSLASVYNYNGENIGKAGELMPFGEDLTSKVRGINDTFWLKAGNYWYSIHKFYPLVTTYDDEFKIVNQFEVESQLISQRVDNILNFQFTERNNVPASVFSDVKIHQGDLFAMSNGGLHRIDLKSGQVKSIMTFYGKGLNFKKVEGKPLKLAFFAFLGNKLILGHPAMLWNHDLWYVPWNDPPKS